MTFPAYASYTSSYTDWIGVIPPHWRVLPLKLVCKVTPSNVDKKTVEGQHTVRLCNYTDVYYQDTINPDTDFMMASATKEQIAKFALRKGDILITKDSEDPSDIAIPAYVPEDMPGVLCGYHLAILRPQEPNSGAFIKRYIESIEAKAYFATRANGLTRYGLGTMALKNTPVPLPPPNEQRAIAAFLDRETAKIDRLIEKQERLIALLEEKRQAEISHAVTKGLNPSAPMKDSGIDWLGQIPAHWNATPLRRILTSLEQGWSPECEDRQAEEGEWAVLKSGCANRGRFDPSQHKTLPANMQPRPDARIVTGDVLICRASGSPQLIGSAAYVKNAPPQMMMSDKLFRPQMTSSILPAFLARALQSTSGRAQIESSISGAAGLANNITKETVKEIVVAVPPIDEQRDIADHIDANDATTEKMLAPIRRTQEQLRNRRASLISAAVTGKIDVRGLVEVGDDSTEAA